MFMTVSTKHFLENPKVFEAIGFKTYLSLSGFAYMVYGTDEQCRIKRLDNSVKLKLRKNRYLYTIKLNTQEAEELLRQLRCDTREI